MGVCSLMCYEIEPPAPPKSPQPKQSPNLSTEPLYLYTLTFLLAITFLFPKLSILPPLPFQQRVHVLPIQTARSAFDQGSALQLSFLFLSTASHLCKFFVKSFFLFFSSALLILNLFFQSAPKNRPFLSTFSNLARLLAFATSIQTLTLSHVSVPFRISLFYCIIIYHTFFPPVSYLFEYLFNFMFFLSLSFCLTPLFLQPFVLLIFLLISSSFCFSPPSSSPLFNLNCYTSCLTLLFTNHFSYLFFLDLFCFTVLSVLSRG